MGSPSPGAAWWSISSSVLSPSGLSLVSLALPRTLSVPRLSLTSSLLLIYLSISASLLSVSPPLSSLCSTRVSLPLSGSSSRHPRASLVLLSSHSPSSSLHLVAHARPSPRSLSLPLAPPTSLLPVSPLCSSLPRLSSSACSPASRSILAGSLTSNPPSTPSFSPHPLWHHSPLSTSSSSLGLLSLHLSLFSLLSSSTALLSPGPYPLRPPPLSRLLSLDQDHTPARTDFFAFPPGTLAQVSSVHSDPLPSPLSLSSTVTVL
uniref:Uncharacterized protein n=1 Tax=Knipowitschia caucasica TaxID=637954 RepID=A0AAV2IU30_KNICA